MQKSLERSLILTAMASSLKAGGLSVSGSECKGTSSPKIKRVPVSKGFLGRPIFFSDDEGSKNWNLKTSQKLWIRAQRSIGVSRSMRWWDKTLQLNMIEIKSAQEFVDSLSNAGDRLVIVDFYSPGCGGCRALHPKVCQLAELNPNAIFLKVNYEELKKMCHCLHIHVLPFFRFYKGAEGRVCSFSCTNATIKKFKDALAKYGAENCSNGPAKGLNESELLGLASIGEISLNPPLPSTTLGSEMESVVSKAVGGVNGELSKAINGLVGSSSTYEEKTSVLA